MAIANSAQSESPIQHSAEQKRCTACLQPVLRCFCAKITPVQTQLRVVILQYPREQFKPLNSATLVQRMTGAVITRGLSWRNLGAILDEQDINPKEWAALFFKPHTDITRPFIALDRHKKELADRASLKGIVVLDGTWKQAKTLWWRNPWLLKLNRITLNPAHSSLRRQVNAKYLSTVEAVALTLSCLGEKPAVTEALFLSYKECIVKRAESCP